MRQLGLAILLGVSSFAFAQTGVNPLCSMVEALVVNWEIIKWLVVGLLGVMVLGVGIVNLTQGKAAYAIIVVIGGTVLLIATYRLMTAAGTQLQGFSRTCSAQIEFVKPVAKSE
jgi:hypothetical protein